MVCYLYTSFYEVPTSSKLESRSIPIVLHSIEVHSIEVLFQT